MSRSNYSDDCDNLQLWRGAVDSAIHGKRGQRLLHELAEAMDAMPVKELITGELEADGAHCALGVVGVRRGVNMRAIDPENPLQVSKAFNVAPALAQEIAYINDEANYLPETPSDRWKRVREWVTGQLSFSSAAERKESK